MIAKILISMLSLVSLQASADPALVERTVLDCYGEYNSKGGPSGQYFLDRVRIRPLAPEPIPAQSLAWAEGHRIEVSRDEFRLALRAFKDGEPEEVASASAALTESAGLELSFSLPSRAGQIKVVCRRP